MTIDTNAIFQSGDSKTAPVAGYHSYPAQVALFAGRELGRILREKGATLQTVFYPMLNLFMFHIVLGNTVTQANKLFGDGRPSIYGYVALICVVAGMGGSTVSALRISQESRSGLLSRFWTMPVSHTSDLLGRIIAGSVQTLAIVGTTIFAGAILGFRFHGGPLSVIMFLLVPTLFALGFTMLIFAISSVVGDLRVIEVTSILMILLMFFNSGFVPVFAYPGWLQDFVANQPMSVAIDAMNALAWNGEFTMDILKVLAWSIGLIAVSLPLAIRGYRKAACQGSLV